MGHESKYKQRMLRVFFCFTPTASRLNKNGLRKRHPPEDRERNGVILRLASEEKPASAAAFALSKHKAYLYLLDSIRAFPPSETVLTLFRNAKFVDVRTIPLTFGAVRIYCGTKP